MSRQAWANVRSRTASPPSSAAPASAASAEARADFNEAAKLIEQADSFDLYSLNPESEGEDKNGFHGYTVLGKTTLKDKATREKVLAAIKKGVGDSDGKAARCFIPRHGVHAVHKGKTVDLVICFQCLQIRVFVDGKRTQGFLTTGEPQKAFDATLKAARIELAKPAGK